MMYTFTKAFEIETQGDKHEITYIEVQEPAAENMTEMCKIEAFVGRVLKSGRDGINISEDVIEKAKEAKEAEKKEDPMSVKDILDIISASGVDASPAFDSLKKILKATSAKLNGDFACSGGNYNAIPYIMLKEILGFYIINFTTIFD